MNHSVLRLGVNVDHVATVRQVRGTDYPDPVAAAESCARAGAHGITVHLREDRRHIQERDVRTLCRRRLLPVNLEMANTAEILALALELRPDEVCIVPEKREELTTEGGLDVVVAVDAVARTVQECKAAGIAASLFIEPDEAQLEAAARLEVPYVELHTGTYCDTRDGQQSRELERLVSAARRAHQLGLQVNAGHGLNLSNVAGVLQIPHLHTLNIGHSIVARALMVGMEEAVKEMLAPMAAYEGGQPTS